MVCMEIQKSDTTIKYVFELYLQIYGRILVVKYTYKMWHTHFFFQRKVQSQNFVAESDVEEN